MKLNRNANLSNEKFCVQNFQVYKFPINNHFKEMTNLLNKCRINKAINSKL